MQQGCVLCSGMPKFLINPNRSVVMWSDMEIYVTWMILRKRWRTLLTHTARAALDLDRWSGPRFQNSLSECKKNVPQLQNAPNDVLLTPFQRGRPASTLLTASWRSAGSALMKLRCHFKPADAPGWWGKQAPFTSCKCHYNRKQGRGGGQLNTSRTHLCWLIRMQ